MNLDDVETVLQAMDLDVQIALNDCKRGEYTKAAAILQRVSTNAMWCIATMAYEEVLD